MTSQENKKILLEEHYRPPKNIQEAIFDVYEKYIQWRSLREQPYKQFNNQMAADWWQDSREKFWGYLPLSYDLDVPQFFFPETRNQIVSALAKISNLKMKPRFEGVEGFDIIKATILKDFFEYWRRLANQKIKNFWNFLYTIINGTCIVFVGYTSRKKKTKNITMHDPATGETEWEEKDEFESEVTEEICNLEDIFIPKIWEQDLQAQDEIIWRTLLKFSDFKNAFKGYDLADYVVPGMQFADTSIFSQFLSYDVRGSDFVEVIKYFNVPKDRYMIIANGVLLNPIKSKGGKEEVCPLPWNHKKLPFAKTIYEPLDASFFYGMSLPWKVKTPQEALNKTFELLLEREIRSVSSPIITSDPTTELGLEFKPGRIYQVGTDVNQYKELQVNPASSSFWNTINSLQGIIARTGSGGASAVMPSRQPRSATEKAAEEQTKKENAGLYFLFYEDLLEQKVWLVIQNMIQFYTANKAEKILGEKKFHKILSLVNTELAGGGIGNREVRIADNPASIKELKDEAWYRSIFKKERVEIIEVTPKALRQMQFDIKIDFEPDYSPTEERAIYMDFTTALMNMFGQYGLVDPKKVMFKMIDKFGENPVDYTPDALMSEYEMERFGFTAQQPQQQVQPGSMPGVNNANQQMRGRAYGSAGAAARDAGATGMPSPLAGEAMPQKREAMKSTGGVMM